MMAAGERQTIFVGEDISFDGQIAAVIASRETDLRLGIRGSTAADDYRTYSQAGKKSGDAGRWSTGSRFPGEIISCSRKPEPCRI